jgi:predicted esterase
VSELRVLFIHGLESHPQGTKARVLGEHFRTETPRMDTRDFEGCVQAQAAAIRRFRPDVLVGSSFGGAIAVALLQRGLWRGPTLLLAQAAALQGLRPELPTGARVWLVHGSRDDIVPPAASRQLARTGSPSLVRLFEVDDDHRLSAAVADGRLVGWVRELAAAQAASEADGTVRHLRVFLQESTLWPVLVAVMAGLAAILAYGLNTALRTRNPLLLLTVAALAVGSADVIRRDWRRSRPGVVAGGLLGLWALGIALALAAGRYGLF